jgi:two-component system sensor histidine kinase GlrK
VYYPRSFLKFILLGFLLVSLPLVYALAELILSLDRLESQGRQEVLQAAQAGARAVCYTSRRRRSSASRASTRSSTTALLDEYARLRDEFRQTTRQLAALPLEPGSQSALEKLTDREPACTSC